MGQADWLAQSGQQQSERHGGAEFTSPSTRSRTTEINACMRAGGSNEQRPQLNNWTARRLSATNNETDRLGLLLMSPLPCCEKRVRVGRQFCRRKHFGISFSPSICAVSGCHLHNYNYQLCSINVHVYWQKQQQFWCKHQRRVNVIQLYW